MAAADTEFCHQAGRKAGGGAGARQFGALFAAGLDTGAVTHICLGCGFVYDPAAGLPAHGIPPGTKWEDLPDDWECPVCGASKEHFMIEE
jgi:rubredoxin